MRLEICRMQHEKHRCTRCDLSYITESYMTNHSVYTGLKTSSPAVRPHRASATSYSHACWHVRLFLQLIYVNLTGTQVAGRQNNNFFCPASMYFSLWLAFINKSHDFLSQMQRNSSEAYRSHLQNNMAERSKSFQIFASVLLSKIFQRFAFKNFPAICFQTFSSDLLSKIFQRFAFKILPAHELSKSFQKFSSDLLSKSFQKFSSD